MSEYTPKPTNPINKEVNVAGEIDNAVHVLEFLKDHNQAVAEASEKPDGGSPGEYIVLQMLVEGLRSVAERHDETAAITAMKWAKHGVPPHVEEKFKELVEETDQ